MQVILIRQQIQRENANEAAQSHTAAKSSHDAGTQGPIQFRKSR